MMSIANRSFPLAIFTDYINKDVTKPKKGSHFSKKVDRSGKYACFMPVYPKVYNIFTSYP